MINKKNILILGGTSEASELVALLSGKPDIQITLSLAGRTKSPVLPQVNHRIGGFGGILGLTDYIKAEKITALICATHPFAQKMPFNAMEAAKIADIPLLFILRPQWQPQAGDNWLEVDSHSQAILSCGVQSTSTGSQQYAPDPAQPDGSQDNSLNIFLTVGRLELAHYAASSQKYNYVIRSIDEIEDKPVKKAVYITARPPFTVKNEEELLKKYNIDYIITKNSGGAATAAKLAACRKLKIPVIMIRRPQRPDWLHVQSGQEAMEWILKLDNI